MKCLILASGFGTRLYPLTIKRAKARVEYRGKPLLTHIVDRVPNGIDIFVSCNRKSSQTLASGKRIWGDKLRFALKMSGMKSKVRELSAY